MRAENARYVSAGLIVGILALVLLIIFQPAPPPILPTTTGGPPCKVLPENFDLLLGMSQMQNKSAPFKIRNQDGTWHLYVRLVLINNSPCPVNMEWVRATALEVIYADGSLDRSGTATAKQSINVPTPLMPDEGKGWVLLLSPFFEKEPNSITLRLQAKIAELDSPISAEGTYEIYTAS